MVRDNDVKIAWVHASRNKTHCSALTVNLPKSGMPPVGRLRASKIAPHSRHSCLGDKTRLPSTTREPDIETNQTHEPWNKGKPVGQKPPLEPKDIWAIRIHLKNEHQLRDLAMFNLAIDRTLRGRDSVNLRIRDVTRADRILLRAMVVQRKTHRPAQFELTEPARSAVSAWIEKANLKPEHYLFPSRLAKSPHVYKRQYARMVQQWVAAIGLDSTVYGNDSMRRTEGTLIYKPTKNLRAVQLLLGHTKLESTVRYLGIAVDDALEISEQIKI